MDLFQILFLSFVQGLTEFLPISSSAHLILPSEILGWQDQGLAFDVAVHVGSLIAVLYYFRMDVLQLTLAWGKSLQTREQTRESYMAWAVIVATIPAALAGLLFKDFIEGSLRSLRRQQYFLDFCFGGLTPFPDVGKGRANLTGGR